MADAVILLTPILVLGALLLLGFAGCSFEGGFYPVTVLVRVPTTLTVTEIVYRITDPNGEVTMETVPDPPPSYVDGNDNVFSFGGGKRVVGGWMLGCRVTVRENGATAQAGAAGNVMVADQQTPTTGRFQASGTPSGNDFDVRFEGA